jgi:hypothetical protein
LDIGLYAGIQGGSQGASQSKDTKADYKNPLKPVFARSDFFPLSASILPRLADVISHAEKGKRSIRAKKFASGKPA